MDINNIKLDDDEFSLESILKEFGGSAFTENEAEEGSSGLPGEPSKPVSVSTDDSDVHIHTGKIDSGEPADDLSKIIDEICGWDAASGEYNDDKPVIKPDAEKDEPADVAPGTEPAPQKEHKKRKLFPRKGMAKPAQEAAEKEEPPQEAAEKEKPADVAPETESSPKEEHKKRKLFPLKGKAKPAQEAAEKEEPVSEDTEKGEIQTTEIPDEGGYAKSDSYGEKPDEPGPGIELVNDEKKKPASFKEFVSTSVISVLSFIGMKIGQSTHFFKAEAPEEEDDLGEELSCSKAARFYENRIISLRARTKLALVLTAVLMYISFGFPVFGALRQQAVSSAVCLILMLTVMILGLDVITSGLTVMGRKRLSANSLVALSCILSMLDGFIIALGVEAPGLPFCAVSALTLSLTMLGSLLNCRANNVTFRVAASAKRIYTLSAETGLYENSITLLKSVRGTKGFVRRTEEAGPDEAGFSAMAPIVIPAVLLLSLIATIISGSWVSFAHTLSGIFVFAAPASILFSFALPFFVSAMGLAPHGACIAGWSGLYDMGKSKDIIITDRDLFSEEDVSVVQPRILTGADSQEVISMVGSIMAASGCAMSHAFDELMEKGNGTLLEVDEFKCHESGGLVALINGKEVLCGSSGFMQLMNVRLVDKVVNQNSVYLAVNRVLCGIFVMGYNEDKNVKNALSKLLASNRHPIFAIRDFILTPTMLSRKFGIPTDGFDFPPFPKRYSVSAANPSESSKPAAVLSRQGLEAYVDISDHGRRLFTLVNLSYMLSVLSSVLGMILMFIFFAGGNTGATSVTAVLIYMLLWLLPEVIMSFTFRID